MMRETPSDLDRLDQALFRAGVTSRTPEADARVDQAQWEALAKRVAGADARRKREWWSRRRGWPLGQHTQHLGNGTLRGWIPFASVSMMLLGATWVMRSMAVMRQHQMQVYHTMAGQQAALTLNDGTHVMLAPQTTVRIVLGFGRASRTVSLDGEAHFEVPSSQRTPFLVRTGRVRTQVLGTSFSIRCHTADAGTRVAVTEGKVMITAENSYRPGITVTAGNIATVTDSTATMTTIARATQYTEWESGKLVFHQAAVAEVLAALSRWYGYQIRMEDSTLSNRHITAAFDYRSLSSTLNTLKLVLEVNVTVNGDVITLHPRQPVPTPARRPIQNSSSALMEVGR